jgi:hypothetical protein
MAWQQLLDIQKRTKDDAREAALPPSACPIDGLPLDIRQGGVRNCPAGNYTWNG